VFVLLAHCHRCALTIHMLKMISVVIQLEALLGKDPLEWLKLLFNFDSNVIQPPSDCNSTALRPFNDLRYDCRPIIRVWAAAQRPK